MRYCLCMKNNNPIIIHRRFDAEFADTTKWTRARVEVKISSAVIFALRMNKNNTTWQRICWHHGQRIVRHDMNGLNLLLRMLN